MKESNQRWCSDGFEFRCDNGRKLRVTFALDCCDREALHRAVTTGGSDSETVQDVMLAAVGTPLRQRASGVPVEWLTDTGSCYRASRNTAVCPTGFGTGRTRGAGPESNGIAESFVKTIKRDYYQYRRLKPDGLTAAKNLAEAFEHFAQRIHPRSVPGYRSPREYPRQQASNGLR